jgi:hypothetical protein
VIVSYLTTGQTPEYRQTRARAMNSWTEETLHSILKFFVLDVVRNRVVAVSTDPAPDSAFALPFFGRPAGQLPWSHCTMAATVASEEKC